MFSPETALSFATAGIGSAIGEAVAGSSLLVKLGVNAGVNLTFNGFSNSMSGNEFFDGWELSVGSAVLTVAADYLVNNNVQADDAKIPLKGTSVNGDKHQEITKKQADDAIERSKRYKKGFKRFRKKANINHLKGTPKEKERLGESYIGYKSADGKFHKINSMEDLPNKRIKKFDFFMKTKSIDEQGVMVYIDTKIHELQHGKQTLNYIETGNFGRSHELLVSLKWTKERMDIVKEVLKDLGILKHYSTKEIFEATTDFVEFGDEKSFFLWETVDEYNKTGKKIYLNMYDWANQ